MDNEPEAEDIYRELSMGEHLTRDVLSRRKFLAAMGIGATFSVMPGWMEDMAAAATPLKSNEGVLVLIQLAGGNDGLNTLIPLNDGTYVDKRKDINLKSQALTIAPNVGLHPSLSKLAARYKTGSVATFRGIGILKPDLSHFTSTRTWMSGETSETRTGWIGRYLDGLSHNDLNAINFGSALPLALIGAKRNASALPVHGSDLFGGHPTVADQRLFDGIKSFGSKSRGFGTLADSFGGCELDGLNSAVELAPVYPTSSGDGRVTEQLQVAAQLINANLGIRVLHVSISSFDNHIGELPTHAALLKQLDDGIDGFFKTLSDKFASQVTLMTYSEFGRRVGQNGSLGTDHGTASTLFVMGKNVRGGIYGDQVMCNDVDRNGNLNVKIDYRTVYATILDKWLNADSKTVLDAKVDEFDLFTAGPGATVPGRPTIPSGPVPADPVAKTEAPRHSYRLVSTGGQVVSYGTAAVGAPAGLNAAVGIASTPAHNGYWTVGADGVVQCVGDAEDFGSMAGKTLNQPIVGIASTKSGKGYILAATDGGVFCFGDAKYFGSMGGKPLNQPITAIAATASGNGYWLIASDGGVFAFGDAPFHGNTLGLKLNKPMVGMAATPSGNGYWMVASDGGIFAFGDAPFFGSLGSIKLNKPIVAMSASSSGQGYRLVARDGGVFCYGDATFEGSGADSGADFVGIAE